MMFEKFFHAATGYEPFAWQRRLAEQVTQGDPARVAWPDVCALPTASGKTSLVLIALYALANHPRAHRRIAYVIDRRIVVDQAYALAKDLRDAFDPPEPALEPFQQQLRSALGLEEGEPTLEVHLLRGGLGEPLARLSSPVTPTILIGTVDQLGSRLLMRGYGVSERMRPIAGGLLSHDTLWILDEAHLSGAFLETLRTVQETVANAPFAADRPLHVIEVSATPRSASRTIFKLGVPDERIAPRIEAHKKIKLIDAPQGKTNAELVAFVEEAVKTGKRRIGVIVNRINLARDVFEQSRKRLKDKAECLLFIGPIRPYDRDRLFERPSAQALEAQAKEPYDKPIIAICTQTVEVGADLDFDALFVQAAPLDVLRQRFGRLDRLGRSGAATGAIVYEPDSKKERLYGDATDRAMSWLCSVADTGGNVDFGISAMSALVDGLDAQSRETLCTEPERGEPLHPEHQRRLAHTALQTDVGIFLHGDPDRGDVQVVWRAALQKGEETRWCKLALAMPPCTREALAVPLYAARSFLKTLTIDVADIPVTLEVPERGRSRRALRWSSEPDHVSIVFERDLRVGDTILIPTTYGGADEFGWAPFSDAEVSDLSVQAFVSPPAAITDLSMLRAARLVLTVPDGGPPLDARVTDELETIAADTAQSDLHRGIAAHIAECSAKRTIAKIDEQCYCVAWRQGLDDVQNESADASSFTREIPLLAHLHDVEFRTRDLATRCGLPPNVVELLARAALLHDLGKADERFQVVLRGGDLMAALTEEPLAKGLRRFLGASLLVAPEDRWRRGMRHEAISVAMLGADDPLVRHLVGTHHGYGRPGFPSVEDLSPRTDQFSLDGVSFEGSSDHRLSRNGWDEQFAGLLDRYGLWGLAYLEAILRLADHRCSREEEGQQRYEVIDGAA